MTRHPIAPFSSIASREGLARDPCPGALVVSGGIGPGLDTLNVVEHGILPLLGFRIVPGIGHVMDPPDRRHRSPHGAFTVLWRSSVCIRRASSCQVGRFPAWSTIIKSQRYARKSANSGPLGNQPSARRVSGSLGNRSLNRLANRRKALRSDACWVSSVGSSEFAQNSVSNGMAMP